MNLITNQADIDKIYLYAKGPYEAKYQYLINKREKVGSDHYDDPKPFMEYSNDMQDDMQPFFKGNSAPMNFIGFKGPQHIFKDIYNDSTALEDVEKEQKSLKE